MEKTAASYNDWRTFGYLIVETYRDFFIWLFKKHVPWKEIVRQFGEITVRTLVTIILGAVVQGLFIAWIEGYYGTWWGATVYVGAGSVQAVLLETSVLMCGILFACRAGTGFTVEINSMNIQGQLDALRLMDVEPVQYLVIPRALTSALILPIFVGISHGIAILSSFFFMWWWFEIPWDVFIDSAFRFLRYEMVTRSLTRAAVIGFAVAINASAMGLVHTQSAEEMGHITTRSIVLNNFTVFLIDLAIGVASILSVRYNP
jgi:phospholipid/cholesterol/gamma-HCH transport system permease protein